nr:uncharacterized protein LOC117274803 [Nicotiana tomentosiformis]
MGDTSTPQIDYRHPLYLQPSDTPRAILIDIKLTCPENYGLWSRSMHLALLGKNKLGFVEGTCVKSLYKGELAYLWEQYNVVVLSWIGGSISQELLSSIVYASDASKQRLVQFLVGLNETYAHVRSQIPLKTTVVIVNQAYTLVIQEESQRALGVMDLNKEPLTILAGRGQMMKGNKLVLICEHHGYKGHQKKNCYKIVGYLPDFKSKKKTMQGIGFRTYVNNTTVERTNFVEGLYNDKVMGIGRESDGFYILQEHTKPVVGAAVIKGKHDTKLWHSRLGHPSMKAMQHLLTLRNLADEYRGPYKRPTYDKKHYFVTIVVDFSRYTWICLIQSKHEVLVVLTNFFSMKKNQFGMTVKVLRSDNGTKFFNSKCNDLLYGVGVIHQILNGKSPYEILHGKVPKTEHLRVFGCLCYASVLPREDKFAARAKKTRGYISFQRKKHENIWEDDLFLADTIAHKDVPSANSEENFQYSPSIEQYVTIDQETTIDTNSEATHLEEDDINSKLEPEFLDEQTQHETFTDFQTAGEQPVGSEIDSSRPSRVTKPPSWLKDYVDGKKSSAFCKYPITNYVAYNHLYPTYQTYVGLVTTFTEPRSFKEATQEEKWVEAMKQEISALQDNHTWEVVDLPVGKQIVGSKWVYKIKYKANGEVDKYKTGLVAKGYTQ